MAEKILNTRLRLKIDTLEKWQASTLVLGKGEIALATVAATAGNGLTEPVIMMKIGDGTHTFSNLSWDFYAKASDVLAAAKSEESLKAFINNVLAESGLASDSSIQALSGRVDVIENDLNNESTGLKKKVSDLDTSLKSIDVNTSIKAALQRFTSPDGSIVIEVAEDVTKFKVAVSTNTTGGANQLQTKSDGLYVAPTTVLLKKAEGSTGYAATYQLVDGNGVQLGDTVINIPKDLVVQEGSVVTNPDSTHTGTFLKLVIQNQEEPIYINVADLIEYVTSGSASTDAIQIAVSDQHKISASIKDASIGLGKFASDVTTALDGKANKSDLGALAAKDVVAMSEVTGLNDALAAKINAADLATIAKTGNVNDLVQTAGDVLILDCGNSGANA